MCGTVRLCSIHSDTFKGCEEMQTRQSRKVWPVVFLVLFGLLVTFSLAAAQMGDDDRGKVGQSIDARTSGGGDPDNPVPLIGNNDQAVPEAIQSSGNRHADVMQRSDWSAAWNRFRVVVDAVCGMTAPVLVL